MDETAKARAFERLVRENQAALYRLAYRLTGNRDDAEDLLTEALTEAWSDFDRFRHDDGFVRWVATIMTHTFLDWKRRASRAEVVSLDNPSPDGDADDEGAWELPDTADDPETIAMRRQFWRAVQKALEELPPEFKAVVVLVDMEGLSYEEAAQALRCPIGTVRSRLHRARTMLRERLKDWL
ncbi:ECF RNA polymerase sigma factor SigE [bacterium HR17]|uniref:ECF RNA polymerase sigma factor SigE n=1 Tax=Candidatus Fervidibacter japonicus TaxID=2035412 RepID=A0A2H5XE78_9BACT|nr:ECF RNA polymerase sigma factor SigE [bacterium HR17]